MLLFAEQNKELDPVEVRIDGSAIVAVNPHESLNGLEKGRLSHLRHLVHEMFTKSTLIPFGWGGIEVKYLFSIKMNRNQYDFYMKINTLHAMPELVVKIKRYTF